ncbi:MAG: hypothetical protein GX083_01575 [Clostridiales bacterium]|nr:hypothetical protein [Clostridiales bacterium]
MSRIERFKENYTQSSSSKKKHITATILVMLIVIVLTVFFLIQKFWYVKAFVAGTSNTVPVYSLDDKSILVEAGNITRGSRINRYIKKIRNDNHIYNRIKSDGKEFYIESSCLSITSDGAVQEKEVFVRTPATVYVEENGPDILSFVSKGTKLTVIGYDKLMDDGYVNKYRVKLPTTKESEKSIEGYVYGKYMKGTLEEASQNYNKNGEYNKAKKDVFSYNLYGGKAVNLDYFPYEKTKIKGNEFCENARTMYINTYAAVHPEEYVKLIEETDCNAVVIDIKDGPLTYKSEVAKEYSPNSYKKAYTSEENFRKGVETYKKTGVYLIGRIVVFNDKRYAKDHPENCIKSGSNTSWPSGFSRDVWEYNVKLAVEAVEKFGFNEIQFDYVRFPEASYEMSKSKKTDFRNEYGEEKAQAIQNFCFYSTDQLREVGAYTSIDVFGESAYGYVTAYGQYWSSISNIVDAISAMPYTDHFANDKSWENPYGAVLNWAMYAKKQQNSIQNPAAARTWITGYDTPYWDPYVQYGSSKMKDQIKALNKAGLKGGFIPWNVLSDIAKYREYQSIWNE